MSQARIRAERLVKHFNGAVPKRRLLLEPVGVRSLVEELSLKYTQQLPAVEVVEDVAGLVRKVLGKLELLEAVKATPKAVQSLSGKVTKLTAAVQTLSINVGQVSEDVAELRSRWEDLEERGTELVEQLQASR